MSKPGPLRCEWAVGDLDEKYHDEEWGVPVHDDRTLFEFLTLEGAQAGLSWSTILKKRKGYTHLFYLFDVNRVARMTEDDQVRLLKDPRIVRNRLKVSSTITNAQAFIEVQKELGSFARYIWSFVGGTPRKNSFRNLNEVPAKTPEAEAMSRDLKKRGFRFVGPTICYAFMQACGLVNDHTVDCFRWGECASVESSDSIKLRDR